DDRARYRLIESVGRIYATAGRRRTSVGDHDAAGRCHASLRRVRKLANVRGFGQLRRNPFRAAIPPVGLRPELEADSARGFKDMGATKALFAKDDGKGRPSASVR